MASSEECALRASRTLKMKKPRGSRRGFFASIGYRRSMRQNRQQQQRYNVGNLDHRVHSRTCRILVGIADGVAGHRGLVGIGALAAVVTVLDVLLGVIPGAAA